MTQDARTPGADEPLDGRDAALLQEVALMFDDVDPVPADLVERVQFALALDEVFDEVAEMTRMPADAMSMRTDVTNVVHSDTLTFSAARLTAMVTVARTGPGRVRLDGWVSPQGTRRVDLRRQGTRERLSTDADGRFAVDDLREGFVQLIFHSAGLDEIDEVVVTPLFKL